MFERALDEQVVGMMSVVFFILHALPLTTLAEK
jgi:hypothetical protein